MDTATLERTLTRMCETAIGDAEKTRAALAAALTGPARHSYADDIRTHLRAHGAAQPWYAVREVAKTHGIEKAARAVYTQATSRLLDGGLNLGSSCQITNQEELYAHEGWRLYAYRVKELLAAAE